MDMRERETDKTEREEREYLFVCSIDLLYAVTAFKRTEIIYFSYSIPNTYV